MSQNDKLLLAKGLPVLNHSQKSQLRAQWQAETWDDMILSLNSYGKYIMLRPTGFGKTYTCACACNIGADLTNNQLVLNNGTVITNRKIKQIHKKKVIFVYVSDILKNTFEAYERPNKHGKTVIKPDNKGNSRIIYETYSMVQRHWNDMKYLKEEMDIDNVGLVIFDEVQRMGAKETTKALDVAIKMLDELGIFYIGATATVERATGYDVCDKYFTNKNTNGTMSYCWGEHIYTLNDTFQSGLLIPPEYQYIEENKSLIKKARHTRLSMLQELKAELVNSSTTDKQARFAEIQELESAVIKNSSKIIHDTMLTLYDCPSSYVQNTQELPKANFASIQCPNELPKYMRFLVFTPDRKSMSEHVKDMNSTQVFKGMVGQTYDDFKEAFGRYGYKVRTLIISSANRTEHDNVRLIDSGTVTAEDIENERAILPRDMTIDLIFSINMLNVGYHVENITGLIFKRWTGSNQIFYQQLGRCLSANSDIIPVVFDFVKSIDSRGITAPLFTAAERDRQVTENADGTQNVEYNNIKKQNKNNNGSNNDLLLDNEGNLINPKKCNTIDAKYITISMTSASVDDIMQRQMVYQTRENSKKLFNSCYNKYSSTVEVQNGRLISDITNTLTLDSSLRQGIYQTYPKQMKKSYDLSINFKAYLEYLKLREKDVFVEYNALRMYVRDKLNGAKFKGLSAEVNSILAAAKTKNSKGVTIKVLVHDNDKQSFKSNTDVLDVLKEKLVTNNDIILYNR